MKSKLLENGFKPNIHGDAFDKGVHRVYFSDGSVYVVEFDNPKTQVVNWKCGLSKSMGDEKIMSVINAMIS